MGETYAVIETVDPPSVGVTMRQMEHLVIDADLAGVELWVGPASQVRGGGGCGGPWLE